MKQHPGGQTQKYSTVQPILTITCVNAITAVELPNQSSPNCFPIVNSLNSGTTCLNQPMLTSMPQISNDQATIKFTYLTYL